MVGTRGWRRDHSIYWCEPAGQVAIRDGWPVYVPRVRVGTSAPAIRFSSPALHVCSIGSRAATSPSLGVQPEKSGTEGDEKAPQKKRKSVTNYESRYAAFVATNAVAEASVGVAESVVDVVG
mgnify:CR=1 FL=1